MRPPLAYTAGLALVGFIAALLTVIAWRRRWSGWKTMLFVIAMLGSKIVEDFVRPYRPQILAAIYFWAVVLGIWVATLHVFFRRLVYRFCHLNDELRPLNESADQQP